MEFGGIKIAHVVCAYPPYRGGMGNVAFEYVERLRERRYDAQVFTLSARAPVKDAEHVHRLKCLLKIGNAGAVPSLVCKLRGFDLVHLHYPFFGGAEFAVLSKILNRNQKLVMTYHMDAVADGVKGIFFASYGKNILPFLTKRADKILVSSLDYARHSALAALNLANKVEEHPFGIDTEKFFPGDETELRNSFGIRQGELVLLFVGGMDKAHVFKGVPIMLEALAGMKNYNWRLILVGSGELKEVFRARSGALGIADRTIFAGSVSQDDLPRYYRFADAHLFPSTQRAEAFGLVALEAASSGVPTIASDLPGVRTVVINEETGLLVESGNIVALREAIARLLRDQETRIRFGLAARSRAERLFAWNPLIDRLEQTYESVVNQQALHL
jgi:glycosyltransferase involved in cell wall biosynthesis